VIGARRAAIAAVAIVIAGGARADVSSGVDPLAAALVDKWLAAQNAGDFAAYRALYAAKFTGIRRSGARTVELDLDGWMKDRARMFAKKMTVRADELRTTASADGVHARFRQTFASGRYQDAGDKELLLVRRGDALEIAREEMLQSIRGGGADSGDAKLIFVPAKSADEAAAAAARMTGAFAGVKAFSFAAGFPETRPNGVALGVCDASALDDVVVTLRQVDPRVTVEPAKGRAPACPTLAQNSDTHEAAWSWPRVESVRAGDDVLSVLVFSRDEAEQGDFARQYKQSQTLALLKDKRGELIDRKLLESESDFSELDGVEAGKRTIAVREKFVDEPCDGTNRHRWAQLQRTVTFGAAAGKLTARVETRKLDGGRCSDDEARAVSGEHHR